MLLNGLITVGHLGGFQSCGETAVSGRLSHPPAMKGEWGLGERDRQVQSAAPLGDEMHGPM